MKNNNCNIYCVTLRLKTHKKFPIILHPNIIFKTQHVNYTENILKIKFVLPLA